MKLILLIDFDGSCVTHDYPLIGKDIGAIPVLKKLIENKHKLILFTMRSGKELQDAVNWFGTNGLTLYGINENPTQKHWTTSPKPYGHIILDDTALGCPLKTDLELSPRPFLDWIEIEKILLSTKII